MAQEITQKIENYFSKYPLRTYPKDQILIHASENPDKILFLVSGNVRQYDISYRGDEIVLNVYKSGAFFPMLGALTGIENKYFFSSDTAVDVRVVPASDVVDFLKNNPDVTLDLLRRLYSGVDGLLGRMVRLMAGSAQSRLVYELVVECRRFGEIAEDGSCLISLSEGDLAARAGLSRETVSREMQKISRDKLVNVSHSGILILDIAKLEQKISQEI